MIFTFLIPSPGKDSSVWSEAVAWLAAEAPLEGDSVLVLRQVHGLHEFFNSHDALVPVTGGMRRVTGIAAVWCSHTVLVRGIAFDQMALWDPMKREISWSKSPASSAGVRIQPVPGCSLGSW